MDTYVYGLDDLGAVFNSVTTGAAALVLIVAYLKARFPLALYGERTMLLTMLGGPVLMLAGFLLDLTPDAMTWQMALQEGVKVSLLAMGGHTALKTTAEARTANKAKAAKKAEAAAAAEQRREQVQADLRRQSGHLPPEAVQQVAQQVRRDLERSASRGV